VIGTNRTACWTPGIWWTVEHQDPNGGGSVFISFFFVLVCSQIVLGISFPFSFYYTIASILLLSKKYFIDALKWYNVI
jgi:hypothetical protein